MRLGDRPGAGVAAVIAATLVFSMGFPIVKGIGLPAASIGFWRLAVGVLMLAGVAVAVGLRRPVRWTPVLLAGLVFAGHQVVYVQAAQWTSLAIVTIFGALQPLLVSVVSRRTVGEPVPRRLIMWAAVALAGIATVALATAGHESRSLAGDALAALNLLLFTTYFLLAKRSALSGTSALSFTLWFMLVALVALAPALLFVDRVVPPTAVDATWLVVLAVIPGNGHLLVNWAHGRVSAALSSLVLTGVPVLGSVWGRVFFDEPFGIAHVVGLSLVVAAIEGGRRVEATRRRSANRPPDATREPPDTGR
jgi:drug/metabolite transporter (DMT)-like permease